MIAVLLLSGCHRADQSAQAHTTRPAHPSNPIADRFEAYQGSYRLVVPLSDHQRQEDLEGSANLWVGEDGAVYIATTYTEPPYYFWGRIWFELATAQIRCWFLNVTRGEITGIGRLQEDGQVVLDLRQDKSPKTLRMTYTFVSADALIMNANLLREGKEPELLGVESWTRLSKEPDRTWTPIPTRPWAEASRNSPCLRPTQ